MQKNVLKMQRIVRKKCEKTSVRNANKCPLNLGKYVPKKCIKCP